MTLPDSLPDHPTPRAERRQLPFLRWLRAQLSLPMRAGWRVRAVSWNLLNGGLDGAEHQDMTRFEEEVRILAELRPDVLGLQECTWWHEDDQRLLKRLAKELGLSVVRMEQSAIGDGANQTALLYRSKVLTLVEHKSMGRGIYAHALIRATFRPVGAPEDGTCDFMVFTTHLHPWNGDARLAEARRITDFGGDFPGVPSRSLLLGDLNTLDRRVWPWQWRQIPRNLWSRYRLLRPSGRWGGIDRRAVKILLRSGWVDPQRLTGRKRTDTGGYYYSNESKHGSLDYALVHGLDVTDYRTADSSEARAVSDHLPVVLDAVVNQGPTRLQGWLWVGRARRRFSHVPSSLGDLDHLGLATSDRTSES